ncbi:MAG: 50S ribosomal protein L22 [Pseudomonadota bacterium]
MEVKAVLKHVRISPLKARLVADAIRGEKIDTAVVTLKYLTKKGAGIILKVVNSAIANAQQTKKIDVDNLYVKTITVDEGPTMKRFMPRAMGRASRIRKRTSHIKVILDEQ